MDRFFMANRAAEHHDKRKRSSRRSGLSILVILCLIIFSAFPTKAAEAGTGHPADPEAFCLRVSDVRMGLSELVGFSKEENKKVHSDLSMALLENAREERSPSLFVITAEIMESGILAALSLLIISDVRVICWFEEKKKRRKQRL